jgi:hypothetical protein
LRVSQRLPQDLRAFRPISVGFAAHLRQHPPARIGKSLCGGLAKSAMSSQDQNGFHLKSSGVERPSVWVINGHAAIADLEK